MNIQHYNQQKTKAHNTFIHTTKSCWRRSCWRFPSDWNPIHHSWAMQTFRDPSTGASHSSSIKTCPCRSKSLNLAARICLVFSGSETRWCGFTGSDMAAFLVSSRRVQSHSRCSKVSTLSCSHSLKRSFATSISYRYDFNYLAWLYHSL